MKLKVPPVFVFIVFGLLMYLLSYCLPIGYFDFYGRKYLIYILGVIAGIVGVISVLQFFKAKTTIDPRDPEKASKLVVNGVYKYSRNPMYLGLLMLLLVWAIWLANAFNILLVAGFVSYMNKFQIIPEEKTLGALFGKSYRQYCSLVRRWF